MRARLSGGHFRMINEKLYTCTYVMSCYLLACFILFSDFCISNLDSLLYVVCYVVSCLFSGKEALDYFKEEPSLFDMVRVCFNLHSLDKKKKKTHDFLCN